MSKTWELLASEFQCQLANIYPAEEIEQLFIITLEDVLGIKKVDFSRIRQELVTANQISQLEVVLKQLLTGRPIQHITGKAFFYKSFFKVSEHTLIPRPETEELVHMVIHDINDLDKLSIIDIGTGTGCIPISIANQAPQHQYWAIDISNEALKIARDNASIYKADIK